MARVTGPLMSMDASGTLAGAITFTRWKGRAVVRRHAVPANPRTPGQVAARAIIAFLGPEWAGISPPDQSTWAAQAEALKISPFNRYAGVNARNWRDGLPPSTTTPAPRVGVPGTMGAMSGVAVGRLAVLSSAITAGAADWGIILLRSLAAIVTPSLSMSIQIADAPTYNGAFTDGPLAPGTYHYRAAVFTQDGVLSVWNADCPVTIP